MNQSAQHPGARRRRSGRAARIAAASCALPLSVVLLAACSSAGSTGGTTPIANTAPTSSAATPGNGGGRTFPGATGTIAAITGNAMQVQSSTAQTTVTFSSSTRFMASVHAQVVAGDCVNVTGTPVSGSSSAMTATTVRVSKPTNGSCATSVIGDGRRGGGFGSPGARPSFNGSPPAGSGGAGSGARGFGDRTVAGGKVTQVTATGFVLEGVLRSLGFGRETASGSPSAQPSTQPITVTLSSGAQVTTTTTTTSAAAKVGECATAIGTTNSTGAIAARTISLSTPTSAGCTAAGFGGGFGGFGGGSGSSGSGTVTNG
jgi:hypothetical protein